jgi:hypothetical protein
VLYSISGMGMGLLFTEIEPEHRYLLQQWVAELSGSGVPPRPQPDNRYQSSHASAAHSTPEYSPEVEHELVSAPEARGGNDEQHTAS